MTDPCRADLLDHAEGEIIVLTSFESDPESADLPQDLGAIRRQMGHEVEREQKVVAKIRLELEIKPPPFVVDHVLIAVDHCGLGVPADFVCDPIESIGRELVIVVEQNAKFARGDRKRRIRSGGNMPVSVTVNNLDPLVEQRIFVEHRSNMRLGRVIVGDAQFPVLIHLAEHRIDTFSQPDLVDVIHGHDDRDQRQPRHFGDLTLDRFSRRRIQRAIGRDPFLFAFTVRDPGCDVPDL